MDDAERRLIAALRAGELRAIEHDFKNNRSLELPVSAFDYAVIVSTRGGLEIDNAASDDDGMRASTQPTRQNLMFFTREVMTTFGSDRLSTTPVYKGSVTGNAVQKSKVCTNELGHTKPLARARRRPPQKGLEGFFAIYHATRPADAGPVTLAELKKAIVGTTLSQATRVQLQALLKNQPGGGASRGKPRKIRRT